MFMVMIVHAVMAIGLPSANEISIYPLKSFVGVLIESLSIICVNVYILISGFYGIKFKLQSLLKLLFQTCFFVVILFLIFEPDKSLSNISLSIWNLITIKDYWFIRAYVVLFLIAPMINIYIESAPKRQFELLIILYFIIQTVFAYFSQSSWWQDGYSPLTFLGIYMLGRYIKLYPNKFFDLPKRYDLLIYMSLSLLISVLYIIFTVLFQSSGKVFNYVCPLVVLSSVYFFLFFSKIKIQSKLVNTFAAGAFACYLVHMSPFFFEHYYKDILLSFFRESGTLLFLAKSLGYLILIFGISAIVDRLRSYLFDSLKIDKKTIAS